eukprot:c8242_g1_i1.p1 GENE.c8242_g1_i1~~c8242_g1_i1.p1  ORF type:complete len:302 (-),score=76.46 c8242_g1_i1:22-927(-)
MLGFVNVLKPSGPTSFDMVALVRRVLSVQKVGHAGTLDPMATGVLPIAVGNATRLINYLSSEKVYKATVRFGAISDTDDIQGTIIERKPEIARELTLKQISAVLPKFIGTIQQVPPIFSAVHVQGHRAYKLARSSSQDSEKLLSQLKPRSVQVHSIHVDSWVPADRSDPNSLPEMTVTISCGGGTYIRSIARDIGHHLHAGALLSALHRAQSGIFRDTENAVSPSQIKKNLDLIPAHVALAHLPSIILSEGQAQRFCEGQNIRLAVPETSQPICVLDSNQKVLGIGEQASVGVLRSVVVLR